MHQEACVFHCCVFISGVHYQDLIRFQSGAAGPGCRSVEMFRLSSERLLRFWPTGGEIQLFVLGRIIDQPIVPLDSLL